MIGGGRGCKVGSAPDLAGGGGWQPPPVQGEYLNSTFDFLDDVLIFEKILQGPERYRIGKPCKVQSATLPNPKLLITTWEMGTLHPESANIWDWVNQKLQKLLSKLSQLSHKFEGN